MKNRILFSAAVALALSLTACEFGSIPDFGGQGSTAGREWSYCLSIRPVRNP
ncbi:MAG: hypothetical protein J6Y77_02570 [Paludibacteraceae bacterium]|nr:hypothetical protein [Paludibacteraceae bacterium]